MNCCFIHFLGEGVSVRTQPAHSIGGLQRKWRCGSQGSGQTLPTQPARWVALVASIRYFGTTWRRSSNGPQQTAIMYMPRKSGQRVYPSKEEAEYSSSGVCHRGVSKLVWAVRKGPATLQVPRMPSFLSVGRREHWLDMDPCAMREWAIAPLAVTLGLTEALRAGRPGLPVRKLATDVMIENNSLPAKAAYVGRGSFHHRLSTTKWRSPWTPGHNCEAGEWPARYIYRPYQDFPTLGCIALTATQLAEVPRASGAAPLPYYKASKRCQKAWPCP